MDSPSEERGLHTEDKQSTRYTKVKGTAAIEGQIFEYKFCALAYIRTINEGLKFKLGCNVQGYGVFDDVVLQYLDASRKTSHICVQLKRKAKQTIQKQQLLNNKGDFSLIKHYESYIQIEDRFNRREESVERNGSTDEWLFIIYTNADVEEGLKSDKSTEMGQEMFLNTGGSVLQFNEEEHEDIYELVKEEPTYREFLSRYRIMYKQANDEEIDHHIIPPLQEKLKLPDSEMELACRYFCDFIKGWWQNDKSSYFLEETNHRENDPLQNTSEKVRITLVAKVLDERKRELDELNIKYEESAITATKKLIKPHKAVLIFAPGRSTTLTTAKIHQMLSATTHIILKLQQLVRYKTEVLSAWKPKFKVMVLEGESCDEDFQDAFNGMSVIVNECDIEKKFIFISSRKGNIQQISALRSTFSTQLTERYDDWRVTDIDTESRKFFLQKKVYFQGAEVKLSNIVKKDDVEMLNALDCDSMSRLLGNEKPSIGVPIEDTVEYYIERTLQCRRDMNPRFPIQGQIQHALNGDILQQSQDIRSHREENLKKRDTPKGWEPRTLLDGGDRLILVADEPGMGKSTLLTHLATETRKSHPETWIVRANLNNCTRILHDIKTNISDEEGAIRLLTEAAQVKENDGVQLEEHLFHYSYNSTGNMAVLIDGVDEVSPHYTEEVIQILKILYNTKIKRIWVTSRNSLKGHLEQELQCQSYSLVPFSEEDQKRFLVKFWSKKCVVVPRDHLEHLAHRVVELSIKHLRDGEKNFMGLPLQSMLLAEMFEENLKNCSTSVTVKLPEYINLVMLYDLYVKKKWDIYLSDKKLSDRTNVNVLTDNDKLYDIFIHNHMSAALLAILSTHHIEKFTDMTIEERGRKFVQKIDEGVEKTGIITDVIEGRSVFQHRTLAEYFVARWLCENIRASQTFMRDHLFESGFCEVRNMLDRILADKCPLHEAVLNSNLRYVERMLRKKESISDKDSGGRTPLHIAVSCRRPELIRLLLEHGANVRSLDTLLGLSSVDYANRMDDWEMLSLIMEKRPVIREHVLNEANHHFMETNASALRAAAKYGHNDLLKYLISKGNSVNMALPGDNSSLLHEAARNQHTDTVKLLVQLGASTDCQDASGKTPLHVSGEIGNLEVTKCIVESQDTVHSEIEVERIANLGRTTTKGNLLNVRDTKGNTALHLAAAAGNTNIVSYLVSAGSDINTCNRIGQYPLTLAARCGENDTVELLLKGDTEVKCDEAKIGELRAAIVAGHVDTTALLLRLEAPVCKGENEKPIHVASRLGREKIITMLMQHSASLMSRTDSGNTALHLANEAGHMSLVRYLVEREGDDMNSLNYENETPLHLATRNGRECLVKYFVENGCTVNATSANGATCLHVACENGHYTTVEYLLKHGAQLNAMNSANRTPLHIAASRGQTEIVELLSLHNANFSLRDTDGITALLAASRHGHQDTVRFIVQHGGNIEDTDGNGNTIAHYAVANENHDILKLLSKQNANLDVQNSDGDTPLLQAVREGRNWILQYLVEKQTDINTQGNDGMRPLDVAVLKDNMEITRLLLERNARSCNAGMHIIAAARFGFLDLLQSFVAMGDDINVKTEDGESPLHVACKSGQVATVQYLSEHGALLDLQDNSGNTALHVAVSNGHHDITRVLVQKGRHVEVVRELLKYGASVNISNNEGGTPLNIASLNGHLDVVRELLNHGAGVDIENNNSCTPLIAAASNGHVEVLRELLKQSARVDTSDVEGCTPLYAAASNGHVEVVRELLKHGAIVDNADYFSWTPLHAAASNGHVEVVRELLKHGAIVDNAGYLSLTPLHAASIKGHVEVLRELLKQSARVDTSDVEGCTPLYAAASNGHVEVVRELLKHGAIVDNANNYSRTPLYAALSEGHVEVVRELLKQSASVDTSDKEGWTPLLVAGWIGHVDVLRELLNHGASVNIANNNGWTPLFVAGFKGHVDILRELLNHGASVNIANNKGCTPLSVAASKGHVEIVRELLNHGANVDIAFNNNIFTPLFIAASCDHVEVVRELLNHGASVDMANNNGLTPLFIAALKGHVEIVRELLNHGAFVDRAENNGCSPLSQAANKDHVEIVRELSNHDASVDIPNIKDCTPLLAAASTGHVEIVRELLNHGASVDIANNNGRTPLNAAASEGHVEVVRELMNHGAGVDNSDEKGWTPLYAAAFFGQVEVVRELINHGAGVYISNNNVWTPLFAAALRGHLEIVRELLKQSASVDTSDEEGWTPLNAAAFFGQVEVVRELINHGAGVDIANNNVWTPLYAAALKGHLEIVRELLNHGASVNTANNKGCTPLTEAASNGHVNVVRELLKHGASVDIADDEGDTCLHNASLYGHVEIVRELLSHCASVDIANKSGCTPLILACSNCNLEAYRELMIFSALTSTAIEQWWTYLNKSASKNHLEVVQLLLNHGATVDIANNNGWTPLNIAALSGSVDIIRDLLNHDASVDISNNYHYTPLNIAASNGHLEIVRELLNHGANVNNADENGWTPLKAAALKRHVEVVRELQKHGGM